jgi:hypothetical protein
MKKVFITVTLLLLFPSKIIPESPYIQACEECKKRASQCIDDEGYNNCLKLIAKCNRICRKIYNINITEQTSTVNPSERSPTKKKTDEESNENIEIFGTENISITVIKIKKCGMKKTPGLQIWYTINNLKRGFGLCRDMITYKCMIMKRDKTKEYDLGEKYHYLSQDKEIEITSYIVKVKRKYQLKMVLRTPERKNLIIKFFDFPFEILSFEKRTPNIQQIVRTLYKNKEIDKFRIEDLTKTQWSITVKIVTNPSDNISRLMFNIITNNQINNAFISLEDINSGREEIISEINIPNDEWGPGEQKVIISILDKKAKLSLWTKTAGIPFERKYNITEYLPSK